MDSHAFDQNRRTFLLATAVAAAGAVAVVVGCDQPQGMRPPRGNGADAGSKPDAAGAAGGASKTASTQPIAEPAGAKGAQVEAVEETPAAPVAKPLPPMERPLPPTSEPAIRIRTGGLPKADPKLQVSGPGASIWIIEADAGRAGIVAVSPVEFLWTAAGWKVTEAAGSKRAKSIGVTSRATLEITALRGEPQRLRVYGSEWPGTLRLVPQLSDVETPVDIVHEVAMETYLPGVISRELFNKWSARNGHSHDLWQHINLPQCLL